MDLGGGVGVVMAAVDGGGGGELGGEGCSDLG